MHRELHMRNDKKPFDDKRVRQAMALAVDRSALVDGLFAGKADVGNDSPFAPVFPSTDTSVPQRKQDIEKAKAADAAGRRQQRVGHAEHVGRLRDPDLAQLMQNDAAKVGINAQA